MSTLTKTEALYELFNSFGVDAYPSGNVPEGAKYPYLTYTKGVGSPYESTLHYYDYTESEISPDLAMDRICDRFRNGGVHVEYDKGVIWAYISHDDAHWYASPDEADRFRKHRLANISLDFEGEF